VRARLILWAAFAIVHLFVAWLGALEPNQPMGDVYFVYEPWSTAALKGAGIVGITETWVYPHLALAPMILAHAFAWIGNYIIGWAVLVTLCNAVGFWVLVGDGRSRSRRAAAGFWLAFVLAVGPVGMYRIDAITVPLAIAALLWLVRRPMLSAAMLTAGAWIKIWPAALVATAFVAMRRRWDIVAGALVTTAVVVAVVLVSGGAPHLLGFVTEQTGRGLQIEAPLATPYLWGAAAGLPGWSLYYDQEILTFQVSGPGVDVVSAVLTPVLALLAAGVALLGAAKVRRGASFARLMPPLALALVLVLIVVNKVGSPQFHVWLIAPVAFWLVVDRHRAFPLAALALLSAALTHLLYPIVYWQLLSAEPLGVAVLTARNVVLVALLTWTLVRLARVPVVPRAAAASPARPARDTEPAS